MEKKEWLNLQTHKLMSDQENPERDSVILGQVSTLQPAPGDTNRMGWQHWVSHSGSICLVLKMMSLRVLALVVYTSGTGMLRPEGVLPMYSQNWQRTLTWPWLFWSVLVVLWEILLSHTLPSASPTSFTENLLVISWQGAAIWVPEGPWGMFFLLFSEQQPGRY